MEESAVDLHTANFAVVSDAMKATERNTKQTQDRDLLHRLRSAFFLDQESDSFDSSESSE